MTYTLLEGNNLELLPTLPDCSVDAIVTDPPYELGFMGKSWDASGIAYNTELWRECLRVLKHGGHMLAFSGSRTYHRMVVAIEDAGFEIRDQIMWVYGSGFPKSLDVSKAIDKRGGTMAWQTDFANYLKTIKPQNITTKMINDHVSAGSKSNFWGHFTDTTSQPFLPTQNQYQLLKQILPIGNEWDQFFLPEAEREVIGTKTSGIANKEEGQRHTIGASKSISVDITAPATSEAQQWSGWGTALKPAHEPIVLARKPLVGTVAANVLQHGTGALNIDGCRIGDEGGTKKGNPPKEKSNGIYGDGINGACEIVQLNAGRFPANFIHDGSEEVLEGLKDFARFFYCAKASKAERNTGLQGMPERRPDERTDVGMGTFAEKGVAKQSNFHPTVKPLALMRYLIRLITPPNGTVLDPFAGSGTTLVAAIQEGFHCIGIELTEDYYPIIHARCEHAQTPPDQPTLFT